MLLAILVWCSFVRKEFAYSDYRVTEIITGYGRLIHKEMEKIGFECYGFQTVFGFTDSIFIRHITASVATQNDTTTDSSNQYIAQFLEDCQHKLNVKIEHKNRFLFTSSLIRRIARLLGLANLKIYQS
jgi:hypothetical protein